MVRHGADAEGSDDSRPSSDPLYALSPVLDSSDAMPFAFLQYEFQALSILLSGISSSVHGSFFNELAGTFSGGPALLSGVPRGLTPSGDNR